MISMSVINRAQCIDKPCDLFASCSSRIMVRMGQSIIFVRKQAIRHICKGCIPNQKRQTYHLCGKMQSSKRKSKIRGNQRGLREHDDTPMDITQVGVWQILQLHVHNNTLSTASGISLQSYTLQQPESAAAMMGQSWIVYVSTYWRQSTKATQGAMGTAVTLMHDHYLGSLPGLWGQAVCKAGAPGCSPLWGVGYLCRKTQVSSKKAMCAKRQTAARSCTPCVQSFSREG